MARLSGLPASQLLLVGLLLSLATVGVVVEARSQQQEDASLVEVRADASPTVDPTSLQVDPDRMSCQALGYVSSACPNVDWMTYQWIAEKARDLRNIDSGLDFLFAGAKFHHGGTRLCQKWYRDLMCRAAFPKCESSQNGPCRSECETFSLSCPGLAMSCAAFDTPTSGGCWVSKTPYVYGQSNAAAATARVGAVAVLFSMAAAWMAMLRQ